ncbi:unnamed protein product [Paramecium octaurelia]|uniref:Uncharacterized protein n=1 Tax=Paramecium octaurelia TaxID=43137 RepID=A0A8S1S102_PAROT|nr:unnamed protein product [Paramecium octaurelia]
MQNNKIGIFDYMMASLVNCSLIRSQKGILLLKLVILCLMISNGNQTKMVYRNFFSNPLIQNNDWKKINKDLNYQYDITSCGSSRILFIDNMATQYNVLVHKSFGLDSHDQLSIELKLWKIDNWNSNTFLIYIDNEIIYNEILSCSSNAINSCGDSQNDEVTFISKTIVHDRPSMQIVMLGQNGKWGISEFILNIEEAITEISFFDLNTLLVQKLFMQSFTSTQFFSINISDQWEYQGTASNRVDFCHDLYYHQSQGLSFEKQITLPNHVAISLKLKVMIFNSNQTSITLKIDDIVVQQWSYQQQWVNYIHTDTTYDGYWYHYTQYYQILSFQSFNQNHNSSGLNRFSLYPLGSMDWDSRISTFRYINFYRQYL